ncbi:MAG: hypothetical protein O7A67_00335 [SAR324 cluster bacterium]|nr:hypothetical protein [SAR324 cluster bacterium]
MSTTRKELIYHGAGFPVRLVNFPCYEDEDGYAPEYPLMRLQTVIAYHVIQKPNLLTGNEFAFLRAVADLSRSETARRLGKARRTVINWEEKGDSAIGADPLVHLVLRQFFYAWIFPGQDTIPDRLFSIVAGVSQELVSIDYRDLETLPDLEGYRRSRSTDWRVWYIGETFRDAKNRLVGIERG